MRSLLLEKWIVMMIITYLFQGEREHIGFYSPTIQKISVILKINENSLYMVNCIVYFD